MWFKYGLKAQKLQKQHALKGQKLLAQGVWGLHDSFCPLPLPLPSAGDRWFRACGAYMRILNN